MLLLAITAVVTWVTSVSANPVPAQGPVNGQGVPKSLPRNESALYPPYTYDNGRHYTPDMTGSPLRNLNESKKPWETVHASSSVKRPQSFAAQASCGGPTASNPSTYWLEQIKHDGTSPFINDDDWVVFRNVVSQYGADSSGNSDSASAIQNAINDGSGSGYSRSSNSLGTTGQPAVVYLPAGTYTINSPLQLYVGTVLIGDPIGGTTIKAGSGFNGNTLIYGKDPNHDSTINFYIKIQHLTLDSTNIDKDTTFTLLDWSVSQATQLSDVIFNMPNYSSGHTGVTMPEGGSGTFMGNLQFNGGVVGLNMNNQQYEGKSLTFNGCTTGILVSHCFDCVFIDINFMNNEYGLDTHGGDIGFVALLDSTASNINTVVRAPAPSTGDHSLVVEQFTKGSSVTHVVTANGKAVLNDNVQGQAWVWGKIGRAHV